MRLSIACKPVRRPMGTRESVSRYYFIFATHFASEFAARPLDTEYSTANPTRFLGSWWRYAGVCDR